MQETEHHKIIPERVELLEELDQLMGKASVHTTTTYAEKKLQMKSIVINPQLKETIMVTGGCHGNEPAPVYAIRDMLKEGVFTKKMRIVLVPCINPFGIALQQRDNEGKKDLNHNFFKNPPKATQELMDLVTKYKPSFALNLHEDADESKFFLYLEGKSHTTVAKSVVNIARKQIPVYKKHKVRKDLIQDGIIYQPHPDDSFEDYLMQQGIPNFCIETPGLIPLQKRIKVQYEILKYFLT